MATTTKTSYIIARVEPKLKKSARKVLDTVGLSTSDAVTLFLKQVVLQKGIPFSVNIPNAKTRAAMRALERGEGKTFKTTEELFRWLNSDEKK